MILYPSILTDSLEVAQQQLDSVKDLTGVEVVQFDILDGLFAENLTVTPLDLLNLDFGELKVDLHLMVEEPMDTFLEIEGVADQLPIRAIIGQIERMTYQEDFLSEVKRRNWLAGLSVDLFTPLNALDQAQTVLQYLDVVQIMSIEAGFQGQNFQESALTKVSRVKHLAAERGFDWEVIVDGGVKLENFMKIAEAGADGIAVGSALWEGEDLEKVVEEFSSSSS